MSKKTLNVNWICTVKLLVQTRLPQLMVQSLKSLQIEIAAFCKMYSPRMQWIDNQLRI